MPLALHRLHVSALKNSINFLSLLPLSSHLSLYHFSTSSSPTKTSTPPDPDLSIPQFTRTRTPLETQFENWIQTLKPGFTPDDVAAAIQAQSDPDLALDIFRWTAQQRNYKHNQSTYLTAIKTLHAGRRYRHAEALIEEVLAGACGMSLPLYNSIIGFCCSRKFLFNRAFDAYKKMLKSEDCKPNLETYTLLLSALLRRFNKLNVCYVYLHAVKSLTKQMKSCGVIPDSFVLNMIIKAYAKCLELDEAMRVFREMGLYGCEPNGYTYSYLVTGLCEKGKAEEGFRIYNEMKGKGLALKGSSYMVLICGLAMEGRFEKSIEVVLDVFEKGKAPDLLSYKTVLEGLCREGRGDEAFELLEEWRKRDVSMSEKNYKSLLNGLHFVNQE